MMVSRASILLLALAALACEPIIGPDDLLPPDAVRTEPLEDYAVWYAQVEECTGETGDFSRVRWFAVPYDRWWDPVWEQYAIGTWREPHDIYLARAHSENYQLVKHEIVHELLQGGDTYDSRFVRCSGIGH